MVSGLTGIIMIILTMIIYHEDNKIINAMNISQNTQDYINLLNISIIFNIIWTICGSIMFWRDCIDSEPSNINTLM